MSLHRRIVPDLGPLTTEIGEDYASNFSINKHVFVQKLLKS